MIFASQSLELDGPVAKLGFQRLASRDLLAQRLVVFLQAQPAKSLLIQSEPGCQQQNGRKNQRVEKSLGPCVAVDDPRINRAQHG